jgi:hypothetical protein
MQSPDSSLKQSELPDVILLEAYHHESGNPMQIGVSSGK